MLDESPFIDEVKAHEREAYHAFRSDPANQSEASNLGISIEEFWAIEKSDFCNEYYS